MNRHNPDDLTPEQVDAADGGFRLLTPDEIAVLSERREVSPDFLQRLKKWLRVEFWQAGRCQWIMLPPDQKVFNGGLTYRTKRPDQDLALVDGPEDENEFLEAAGIFVWAFQHMQTSVHDTALRVGWWNEEDDMKRTLSDAGRDDLAIAAMRNITVQRFMLIVSEVAEGTEAERHGNGPDDKIPAFTGIEAELADVVIRIMDIAKRRGWRVAEAIIAKMTMNRQREAMHGGKKF